MRTFIAVRIAMTPAVQNALRELGTMRPTIRLVTEDQLHVTLKFLGETEESQVPELLEVMTQVVHNEPARRVSLKGLGAFPNVNHPTVLWVGFEDSQPLPRLANALTERCLRLGFEPERRPFQPHLTLGRVKSEPPPRLAEYLRANQDVDFGSSVVDRLELYRSDLGHAGPVYTVIGGVPLLQLAKE